MGGGYALAGGSPVRDMAARATGDADGIWDGEAAVFGGIGNGAVCGEGVACAACTCGGVRVFSGASARMAPVTSPLGILPLWSACSIERASSSRFVAAGSPAPRI